MNKSIVIVDDHLLIAKALSSFINDFSGYTVLYEVENGKALQAQFKTPKNIPDIVLLDVSMPIMNGYETALWLTQHHPDVLILALSMQNDDDSLFKMIKNGAKGYLLKNIDPAELETALNHLTTKGYYYPEWAANKLFLNMLDAKKEDVALVKLSDREKEFLHHCCTELSYKEIAEVMICSPRTVEGYRDNLCEKLGVKTRTALALYAVKQGHYIIPK